MKRNFNTAAPIVLVVIAAFNGWVNYGPPEGVLILLLGLAVVLAIYNAAEAIIKEKKT